MSFMHACSLCSASITHTVNTRTVNTRVRNTGCAQATMHVLWFLTRVPRWSKDKTAVQEFFCSLSFIIIKDYLKNAIFFIKILHFAIWK